MRKKAQAAMEFLMTYGWAILVVLIVISALAYFGVLNPQQFLPQKCQFSTGIVCVDKQLKSGGELNLRLSNGLGNAVDITGLKIIGAQDFVECNVSVGEIEVDPVGDKVLLAGDEKTFKISDCRDPSITGSLKPGQRIKADMVLSYRDRQTGFEHDVPGRLLIDVEG